MPDGCESMNWPARSPQMRRVSPAHSEDPANSSAEINSCVQPSPYVMFEYSRGMRSGQRGRVPPVLGLCARLCTRGHHAPARRGCPRPCSPPRHKCLGGSGGADQKDDRPIARETTARPLVATFLRDVSSRRFFVTSLRDVFSVTPLCYVFSIVPSIY